MLRIVTTAYLVLAALGAMNPGARAAPCDGGGAHAILTLGVEGLSNSCELFPPNGFPFIFVYLDASVTPLSSVSFTLPDPPFGTVTIEEYYVPHTGDRTTGIEMDLSGTTAGTYRLAGFLISLPAGVIGGCYPWDIVPGNAVDKDGGVHPSATLHRIFGDGACYSECANYWQECVALPPYDLDPSCDAAGVVVNPTLRWTSSPTAPLIVRVGTSPDLSGAQTFMMTGTELSPGVLQPFTTYYWDVRVDCTGDVCDCAPSAVHRFTTGGATPVQATTWGAVKSRYQE